MDRVSFDDFDWSGTSSPVDPAAPPAQSDEAPPPPQPSPPRPKRRSEEPQQYDESLLPKAYAEYGKKNVYKRQPRRTTSLASVDDFDWSGDATGPRTGEPAYNPDDDWALTRGFKVGEQGGRTSIKSALDMARIAKLSPEEQRAEMLRIGNVVSDASEARLEVEGLTDVGGIGEFFTWLGESAGQMSGSAIAAAELGGLPGGAVGAAVGGAAGATALGAGALPGAGLGAVAGFTSGSIAAFGAMGVGGMFQDLVKDEGVKAGLKDGTIDPDSLIKMSIVAGGVIGALDAIPATKAVGRIGGKEATKVAVKALIKNATLRGMARGAKEEGITEGIQGAISELGQAYEGGDINAVERALSVLDQAAAGAVGGAGPGAVGGYLEGKPPKPDPTVDQEYEIDYETGVSKPSTRAAKALPAGAGAPPASQAPHNPVGGTGQPPVQPAGAGARKARSPAAPIEVVQPGGVPQDIGAAAIAASGASPEQGTPVASTPTAVQPGRQKTTGDVTIDAALGATAAPAPPQPIQPTPQVPGAAPASPIAAPEPSADLYRTGESAYQPPTTPQPVAVEDMAAGLPQPPVPPPEAVQPAAPAPVAPPAEPALVAAPAEPAIVEAPAPVPVELPPEPPSLVSSELTPELPEIVESKAERAKRVSAERKAAKETTRQAEKQKATDQRIVDYAGQLKVESLHDIKEAKDTLNRHVDTPDTYVKYWDAMSAQLRRHLGNEWNPYEDTLVPKYQQERPLGRPRKAFKRPARVQAPQKPAARPRPVSLKPAKLVSAAKPAVTVERARLKREDYENLRRQRGAEGAHKALAEAKAEVHHPKTKKRIGYVERVVYEGKAPKTKAVAQKPMTVEVSGEKYTGTQQVTDAIAQLRKARKTPAVIKQLNALLGFERGPEYGRLLRHEKEPANAPAPQVEHYPEGRLKVSFRAEPIEAAELFEKYEVGTSREKVTAFAPEAATKPNTIAEMVTRLAQHFKVPKARPVLLSSLGMDAQQIAQLEALGLAEDGSMDASEFSRFETSLRGAVKPPPARVAPEGRRGKVKPKTTVGLYKPKPARKGAELYERWRQLNVVTEPTADIELIPETEAKAIGVAELQRRDLTEEAKAGALGKPKRGRAADRVYIAAIKKIMGKLVSGVFSRAEAYKELLEQQQARVDRWAVQHRADEMAKERLGKLDKSKAADAVRGETIPTLIRHARKQKAMPKGERDEIRFRMNPHFDVLSANRGMVKSPTAAGEKARAQTAKANAAIQALKAQLVARSEREDTARVNAELKAAEQEAASENAREREQQREIVKYLREQVKEGNIDIEMADMLADKENREHYGKYTKRIAREEITGRALRAAARNTKLPVTVEEQGARFDPRRKRFTRKERAASREFAAGLRPIVSWTDVGQPGAERAPTNVNDPKHQRIVGMKLPAGYLKNTREVIEAYLTNAKREMTKRGRKKTPLPTRVHPYHNSVEENATVFMGQRLAFSSAPSVRRETSAEFEAYAAKQRELGRSDPRGPERNVAGRKREAGAVEDVRQKTHRTANIHDANMVLHFLKLYAEARDAMASKPAPTTLQLAKLDAEVTKGRDAIYGIIFDHAAMSKFAMEDAGAAPDVGVAEPTRGAIDDALAAQGRETTEGTREAMEADIEAAETGRQQAALEAERSAFMKQKTEMARILSTKYYVATIDGKRRLVESGVTLDEGPVSRGAMDERPIGTPIRTLSGREALDQWATKGQLKGWQRWLRGGLIRSLRKLVGDIDVHVVDGIYANNKAGVFVPGSNPQILINRAALGRPALLADTIIHEMAHAATNYALHNNLRGTRDIINALMRQLRSQIGDDISGLSVEIQNAFLNADEFIAASADHAPFQDMLASLAPDRATRAQVRALGKGRAMPTYWDQIVAAVENAIGFFTPAGTGGSYMSQVLKIYPNIAMTLGEQARHAREGGEMPDANDILEHPLDPRTWGPAIRAAQKSNIGQSIHKALPTDDLRRILAENYFEGEMVNPTTELIDMLQMHPNLVTDEMATADKQDEAIVAWVNEDRPRREAEIAGAYDTLLDSVVNGVDVTRDIAANAWVRDDALHPLKGGRRRKAPTMSHKRDTARREAHAKGRTKWLGYSQAARDLLVKRADIMKAQMARYEHDFTANWVKMLVEQPDHPLVLPKVGRKRMTQADAVAEILAGNISEDLESALGDNHRTIKNMGRMTRQGRLYLPLYRDGSHFISGRRDIPLPDVTRGTVSVDQQKLKDDKFEFVFTDEQDYLDYVADIGQTGDERLISNPYRSYVSSRTGKPLTSSKAEIVRGRKYPALTHWRVPMQDRFMAMHDDPKVLSAQKDELMQQGGMRFVSDPLQVEQKATMSGAMPLKLQRMLDNIDSMSGRSDKEKAVMKAMTRQMFVQTQQGNRITKRLMKRQGNYGYTNDYENMRVSFRTNNEMMSRHIVALDRLPKISAAESYLRTYTDAIARRGQPGAFDELTQKDRDRLTRNYGKLDENTGRQLRADVKIIRDRIEQSMQPRGAPIVPENYWRAFTTAVTMNYLFGPSYLALQTISVPMFTWPRMVGEFARRDSVSGALNRATQYLYAAGTEVGSMGVYQKGISETIMELNEVRKGFVPRENWLSHARTVRRTHNYLDDLYARLRTNGASNVDWKIKMLETMRKRGAIGQAGINQQNLQEDLLGPGVGNKVLRGIKATGKVFQAFQEAAEINNRAVPAIAYFNHFVDTGVAPEQAAELAINKVSSEQVNYSKENWPGITNVRGLSQAFMFKKFGAVQAINYYDSLMRAFVGATPEEVRVARVQLATMTLTLAVLGGFSGNPVWEPLRMLNYLLSIFGLNFLPTDWNEAKTNAEKWMADNLVGSTISEGLMYGATRALGIDISSRIAMDNVLFYKQPEEMSQEEWLKAIGQFYTGAPGTAAMDAISGVHDMVNKGVWGEPGDASWGKDFGKLPFPKVIKDMIKAADLMENGPTTTTGVSTGDAPGMVGALIQSLGFRTREQSRPFEQGSAAQHRIEQHVKDARQAVMQSVTNSGVNSASMRRIRDWNRSHPAKDQRITMKNLHDARKRRRKVELEIRRKNLEAA